MAHGHQRVANGRAGFAVHGLTAHQCPQGLDLVEPLRTLVRREPVHCETGTAVRDALVAMRHERVSSIAVVDDRQRPIGIFTLTDLLDRVVLPGLDLATPIAEVMSPGPGMLDELATAQEALSLMAQLGYHQVMVTREGRLIGVVSERDLFALQRVTMRNIVQSIRLASDLTALQRARQDIDSLTENLIAQGAAAEPLTHTITALNDALTDRLFGLLVPRFELEGIDWCWMSVGSEGGASRRSRPTRTTRSCSSARPARPTRCGPGCCCLPVRPTTHSLNSGFRSAPATSWRATRSTAYRPGMA